MLPAGWLAGGLLALAIGGVPPATLAPAATALILLGVGGLLAANLALPTRFCAGVAVALGLVRGFADLAGTPGGGDLIPALAGMASTAFVLFALAASVTLPLRRYWMIVAARVTGSWLAAAGLLLAGWIIRFGARVQ